MQGPGVCSFLNNHYCTLNYVNLIELAVRSQIGGFSAIGPSRHALDVPHRTAPAKTTHSLRLSWPKVNDKRRAMVARSSIQQRSVRPRLSNAHLVNISTWDIEMHRCPFGLVSIASFQFLQRNHILTTMQLPKLESAYQALLFSEYKPSVAPFTILLSASSFLHCS